MIKRDFHGWTASDALQEVHNIVGDVRRRNSHDVAEFITGHGIIKKSITLLLQTSYDLHPQTQVGNSGVIIVHIE